MPTTLDFIKARVLAYKKTLEDKTVRNEGEHVSIQIAQQVNALVEQIKKEAPESAGQMPQPIAWLTADFAGVADITFLDLEMILNEIIAVLDVLRADH